jgi:hypothetical protein
MKCFRQKRSSAPSIRRPRFPAVLPALPPFMISAFNFFNLELVDPLLQRERAYGGRLHRTVDPRAGRLFFRPQLARRTGISAAP